MSLCTSFVKRLAKSFCPTYRYNKFLSEYPRDTFTAAESEAERNDPIGFTKTLNVECRRNSLEKATVVCSALANS